MSKLSADETGSVRSGRRRARNAGRGEYEDAVRGRLAAVAAGDGGDGSSGVLSGVGWAATSAMLGLWHRTVRAVTQNLAWSLGVGVAGGLLVALATGSAQSRALRVRL